MEETHGLESLGDFLKRLQWHDYEHCPCPEMPHTPARALPTPETESAMEAYRLARVAWRAQVELVRPGAVLFLKSGKFVLVGHVNESLSSQEHFEPDFDYEDILKIAHLW